jgi:hypothetical protein
MTIPMISRSYQRYYHQEQAQCYQDALYLRILCMYPMIFDGMVRTHPYKLSIDRMYLTTVKVLLLLHPLLISQDQT